MFSRDSVNVMILVLFILFGITMSQCIIVQEQIYEARQDIESMRSIAGALRDHKHTYSTGKAYLKPLEN